MSNRPTPETDAACWREGFGVNSECVHAELARKLERERDEAREKIEQQRKEIVRLNGATSHAGGTPLKIALRERDEAREELHDIRLNLGDDADGYTLLHAVCVIQNERNEAREEIKRLKEILDLIKKDLS